MLVNQSLLVRLCELVLVVLLFVGFTRFFRGFKDFKGFEGEGLGGLWVLGRRILLEEEEEGEIVGFLELGMGGLREAETGVAVAVGWDLQASTEG